MPRVAAVAILAYSHPYAVACARARGPAMVGSTAASVLSVGKTLQKRGTLLTVAERRCTSVAVACACVQNGHHAVFLGGRVKREDRPARQGGRVAAP